MAVIKHNKMAVIKVPQTLYRKNQYKQIHFHRCYILFGTVGNEQIPETS